MNMNLLGKADAESFLETAMNGIENTAVQDLEDSDETDETVSEEEGKSKEAEEDQSSEEEEESEEEGSEEEETARKYSNVKEALLAIKELDPAAAKVLEGLQPEYTRLKNEEADIVRLKSELRDGLQQLKDIQGQLEEEEEPEGEDPLDHIPQDQKALLDEYLRRNGYVKQDDLESKEMVEQQNTISQTAIDEAIEMWGDEFGTIGEDGSLVLNPEMKARMAPEYDRVVNRQALTFKDLRILADFPTLVKEAKKAGAAEERKRLQNGTADKVKQVKRGTTVSSSSGRTGPPTVYDRKKHKGVRGLSSVIKNVVNNLEALSER
jgi:hypothetical protein